MDNDLGVEESDFYEEVSDIGNYENGDEDYVEESDDVKPKVRKARPVTTAASRTRHQALLDEEEETDEEEIISPQRRSHKKDRINYAEDNEEELEVQVDAVQDVEDRDEEEEEVEEVEEVASAEGDGDDILEESQENAPNTLEETDQKESTFSDGSASLPMGNSSRTKNSKMLQSLLSDGTSKRKLTEEELQLRRAENARKRKNLSERRAEEEKQDTINKLLRKRAGKSRARTSNEEGAAPVDIQNFQKPRRPYSSEGMITTIRGLKQDYYCTYEMNPQ